MTNLINVTLIRTTLVNKYRTSIDLSHFMRFLSFFLLFISCFFLFFFLCDCDPFFFLAVDPFSWIWYWMVYLFVVYSLHSHSLFWIYFIEQWILIEFINWLAFWLAPPPHFRFIHICRIMEWELFNIFLIDLYRVN